MSAASNAESFLMDQEIKLTDVGIAGLQLSS